MNSTVQVNVKDMKSVGNLIEDACSLGEELLEKEELTTREKKFLSTLDEVVDKF
ncbi:hypothetical protein [Salibacterium lacus]|uniref:Uncharacterized protein n=1 Tax=Salibacterium lacus TaxID=1898109 RepID=A0ABW5SWN4_9BACI